MYSTRGRRRTVTDEQVNRILEWKRSRVTLAQLAQSLNLKKSTVEWVISIDGQYKQPSPELLDECRTQRRRHIASLRTQGWL